MIYFKQTHLFLIQIPTPALFSFILLFALLVSPVKFQSD